MKITLKVNGQDMDFTVQELTGILEEYFSKDSTLQVVESNVPQPPFEGELFKVNPQNIDRSLFSGVRSDKQQEKIRRIINDAFAEVDKCPEKYALPFYTMIPRKNIFEYQNSIALKAHANDLGGLVANWIEQALEWAQRIANGERWEVLCNKADTISWYRMIVWKNKKCVLIGGSRYSNDRNCPTEFVSLEGNPQFWFYYAVPLVVFKDNLFTNKSRHLK